MPKLYLTDSIIESLNCPSEKDQELYWDHPRTLQGGIGKGAVAGLGVRVTINGAKTFVHAALFRGKRRRIALGKVGSLNVASARLLVQQREAQMNAGEDPDLTKHAPRHDPVVTVRDAIGQYWPHFADKSQSHRWQYAYYIAPWLQPRMRRLRRRGQAVKAFGQLYGQHPLTEIKPLDVQSFLDQFESPSSYNNAFATVRALFNWAIRMQIVDMRNPVSPFQKRKLIRQRRDYQPADIKALTRAIFDPTPDCDERMREYCRYMGILFLTMARPAELRRAEFTHFDLQQLIWHKHNTKGLKLSNAVYEYTFRSVPIHPKVAELVREQRLLYPETKLLFPHPNRVDEPRPEFAGLAQKFKALPGIPPFFQLYDLKRIAISLMLVGQGVRREDVSHYVDHKGNLETTAIYDLGFVDPLRPVTAKLGEILGVD